MVDFNDEIQRGMYRHTTSHIMAQAVKRLWPETKLAIGPKIDDGFYYDFDRAEAFTAEDLKAIEDEMKKIIKENLVLERFELPREEAIKFMQEKNEPFKVELINDLPEDAVKDNQDKIQKLTDKYIKIADDLAAEKEKEIMEI